MALTVTIGGTNRTRDLMYGSLKINNVITKRPDSCQFSLITPEYTTAPTMGQEVIVYDGATKIFAGVIIDLEEGAEAKKLLRYDVKCTDYVRLLSRKLVPATYTGQTVEAIIDDLITNYAQSGFTTNNVSCLKVINYIGFNYKPLDKCIEQLANLVGFDWYVDEDRDLHFFAKGTKSAPTDITDDGGVVEQESLVIRRDNSQIKNVIYVRGGEYLGTTFTSEIQADGVETIFNLPGRYNDLSVTLTGDPLTVGIDNISDPNSVDVLYNYQEKFIKFKEADKPSAGATIRYAGAPYIPVIVKERHPQSINTLASAEGGTGEYEFLIVDKTILSKEAARERARAELDAYKETISEGEFVTEYPGFLAGQTVRITSALRGIDEEFILNNVRITEFGTGGSLKYQCSFVTTKTMGILDYLQRLLLSSTEVIEVAKDEVIDTVEAFDETFGISDTTFTASVSHNPQSESVSMDETFTAQSLDYDVEFVLGPLGVDDAPSGKKRIFILDGSPLL